MPTPDDSKPFDIEVREFPQERARRTYEGLLASATKVFAERGFDATQTPDIAAAAGVSVGTFYRYFSDKREVFLEVLRKELADSYKHVMGGLTAEHLLGKERRATIEATMQVLFDNLLRQPKMQRLFVEMALRDEQVAELSRKFDRAAQKRIAELIAAICPPEQVADPEATAYVVHTAVVECANHIAGSHGELPVSRERSLAALTDLVYRALFGFDD